MFAGLGGGLLDLAGGWDGMGWVGMDCGPYISAAESTDGSDSQQPQVLVDVIFRTSVSGDERSALMRAATALLYTPDNVCRPLDL